MFFFPNLYTISSRRGSFISSGYWGFVPRTKAHEGVTLTTKPYLVLGLKTSRSFTFCTLLNLLHSMYKGQPYCTVQCEDN
jgi:hypothetical protein